MSNIFTNTERIDMTVLFMRDYIKFGDKAYERIELTPTTIYMYTIKFKKEIMKDYSEIYEAFLKKKEEVREENVLKGLEKTNKVLAQRTKDKAEYTSNNSIIKYLQDNNISSIKYNEFIDVCIRVFPTCETSVNGLMKKARKFNIDIIKDNKIIN